MRARLLPALVSLAVSLPARAAPPDAPRPSIHAAELRAHEAAAAARRAFPRPTPRALLPGTIVYGYLPYWVSDTSELRFDLLSHIGWFAVEMDSNGVATNRHGWPDDVLVAAAHAAGVKVEIVFTLFSSSGITTLVTDPARRQTAVATALAELEAGGADGVNLDFEGAASGARDGLTAFFCELRQALDGTGHADASISMAGPAVDWSNAWDLASLLDCIDTFFIMGYDYFWSGSSVAGPSGILRVTPLWRPYSSQSEQRSMAYWASLVAPEQRRNIVLGVPYYGMRWSTADDQPGSSALGYIGSVTYAAARGDLADDLAPRLWEAESQTPWYTYASGGREQVWYDDEESLHHKYVMAREQGLGGVGMWALGYDLGYPELWDVIDAEFGAPPPVVPGSRAAPLAITSFPFHDARDTTDPSSAPSNYFNYYGCAPTVPEYGREVVYRLDLCQPGTLTAGVTDGDGVDIDVHLLAGLEEPDCLARDDSAIAETVEPGAYYLVTDTYISDYIEQAGPFDLDVDFAASGGTPCAPDEVCVAGQCTAAAPDGGVAEDGGGPADGGAPADAAGAGDGPAVMRAAECGCAAGPRPGAALACALAILAALLARRRR